MTRQVVRRQPRCWRPDLMTPSRTASDAHQLSAAELARNNRGGLIAVAVWARRHHASLDDVRELVDMLGLDVEAARR